MEKSNALIQRVTRLAEGIKQDRPEETVAEKERQFLEQHGNGLFVDVPANVKIEAPAEEKEEPKEQ